MAAEFPSEERQKKMARDMMRMRSTNSTIAQGPLSAMTAAQKAAAPMRQVSGNTVVNKNTTPMPTVLPKPIMIERSPEYHAARDRANETSSAMAGKKYDETPAAPLRDFQRAMPDMISSSDPRVSSKQMEEQPNTFAAFLKSLGLGK